MDVVIGVNIGQKRDPTAFAVVDLEYREVNVAQRQKGRRQSHYLVRFLERLPLGTPSPGVARRLGQICQRVTERGRRPTVFVDATGVGSPLVSLLKSEATEARVWEVYFNHGDRLLEDSSERRVTLGKAYLVSRLVTLLESDRLHLPKTSEAKVLAHELLEYELSVTENANELYGAFRVGTQDDLVTALGLAVHKEPRRSVYPAPDADPTPYDLPRGLSAMNSGLFGRRGLSGI